MTDIQVLAKEMHKDNAVNKTALKILLNIEPDVYDELALKWTEKK
jgi:hypothetical protein